MTSFPERSAQILRCAKFCVVQKFFVPNACIEHACEVKNGHTKLRHLLFQNNNNTRSGRLSHCSYHLPKAFFVSSVKRLALVLLCLDIFHDIERLYPARGAQLSNNKVSFGIENKKLIKKLLVLGADRSPEGLLATFLYGGVRVNIWGLRYCNKIIFGVCKLPLWKNSIFRA